MIGVLILALITIIIFTFSCIKQEMSVTTSFQPIVPMEVGDIRKFTTNNLSVVFKKTDGDTFNMSILLLNAGGEDDLDNSDFEELILRASLRKVKSNTTVHLTNLNGINALTVQSVSANFYTSLSDLLNVFYNQSFDSLLIDSSRNGRINALDLSSDEDLQRYHADKFVTSRLLFVLEGKFLYKTVQNVIETKFYGRTAGEYSPKALKYPEYPFILKTRPVKRSRN